MVGIIINRYNAIVAAQKLDAPRKEIAMIQMMKDKANEDTKSNPMESKRGTADVSQRVADD